MAPKEPTRFQLSSRLQYEHTTPTFLRRYQNQLAGRPNTPSDDGEEYGEGAVDEFGREIRKTSPNLPEDGGANPQDSRREDDEEQDEAPVVVVLKEGKHLTAEEAEDERRKAQGLPPLKRDATKSDGRPLEDESSNSKPTKSSKPKPSLSFSSTAGSISKARSKRKLDTSEDIASRKTDKSIKKPKKEKKGLLSFDGEDG